MAMPPDPNLTLDEIARHVGGRVIGDGGVRIRAAAPFESAAKDQITWAADAKYLKRVADCRAGAVIVAEAAGAMAGGNYLIVDNPHAAFARVLRLLHPPSRGVAGIHPTAVVGCRFTSGEDLCVAAGVVIGDDVCLGARVRLHPNVVLGNGVVVGDDVEIFPNVTVLDRCRIGHRVVIQASTVIGSDGFGYAPDTTGYMKIVHQGIVQIDDDVEIGAGNTIDRATFGRTWLQRGVRTDNLVHVAHNVVVGEDTLLVAQVGISGSVTLGRRVIVAGQAGIAQHLTVGDQAIVGPQAGVGRDIAPGDTVLGSPELPHRQWLRVQRQLGKLPEMARKLSALEQRLARLQATEADTPD